MGLGANRADGNKTTFASYDYYGRSIDAAGNANLNDFMISFSVAADL